MFFTFQRRVSQIAGAFHSGEHSPAQLRSFLQVGQSSVIVTPVLSLLERLTKVRGGVRSNDSLADGATLQEHVTSVVKHYGERAYCWDVVSPRPLC